MKYTNEISVKENNDADSDVEDGDRVYSSLGSSAEIKFCTGDDVLLKGTITAQGRGDKITVFKMKRRKGYRVKRGHRQEYTELRVERIEG